MKISALRSEIADQFVKDELHLCDVEVFACLDDLLKSDATIVVLPMIREYFDLNEALKKIRRSGVSIVVLTANPFVEQFGLRDVGVDLAISIPMNPAARSEFVRLISIQ